MPLDSYKRRIDYLRISVTDRCNLRCIYCMPEYGILQKPPQDILTFEEIDRIVKLAITIGIDKIKITGGEPFMRRHLPRLLQLLSDAPGLKDLSLTTNGIHLQRYAKELKEAGLKKINVSIDTLDSRKFGYITRFEGLEDVIKGIDSASEEGFFIKLNVVVMKGLNDDEILKFAEFSQERQIIVRFIELMPTINNGIVSQESYIPCDEIKDRLKVLGGLTAISLDVGNGPAEYYKMEGSSLIVGFISPISCRFCYGCNRLRLTADGLLMPCLNSEIKIDVKGPLRENREEEVLDLLKKSILLKPEGHNFSFSSKRECLISQIGG